MRWLTAVLTAWLVVAPPTAFAQSRRYLANTWEIDRLYLTTVAVDISTLAGGPPAGTNVYLCMAAVSASAGTTETITLTSVGGTGLPMFDGVAALSSTAASTVILVNAGGDTGCYKFVGGLKVKASANTTIRFEAGGKYL